MHINWYLNRLKTMSAGEIIFRVRQILQKEKEKRSETGILPVKPLKSLPKKKFPELKIKEYHFRESFRIFDQYLNITHPVDWHKDIQSERKFPMSFSGDIDIRSEKYGSAKHVWEINRMQFLPRFCFAYKSSGKREYLSAFMDHITSWKKSNPYLTGVNWYSNIEVNLRLINWFICWEILNASELYEKDEVFRDFCVDTWIPLIYSHSLFSYKNPSRYSSANNHLVSEYAGLFISASVWKFDESDKWLSYAKKGLEKEIHLQHSEMGVNKEEAAEYIQFITDFFLLSFMVGNYTKNSFSHAYENKLEHILNYIHNFTDLRGQFPNYGDEDDGRCFVLETDDHFNNFYSLILTRSLLFGHPVFKNIKKLQPDIKNLFLFGKEHADNKLKNIGIIPEYSSHFYKNEGHFFMKKGKGDKETYLYFNAAPLGFLSIAAHGHADALSFQLKINGHPIFIDSGTFTYHTHPKWRKYFMSILSHNSVRVDYDNPALIGGPTMWLDHYKSRVLDYSSGKNSDFVAATHNGYKKKGVQHKRRINFDKTTGYIKITDRFEVLDKKKHDLEIPFHTHPQIIIEEKEPHHFHLSHKNTQDIDLSLQLDKKVASSIKKGWLSPITGWYSKSFQQKEEASVIFCTLSIEDTTEILTLIKVKEQP